MPSDSEQQRSILRGVYAEGVIRNYERFTDQIENSPKPATVPQAPPATAAYQDLPNLTTPNPPDQIENSPKPTVAPWTPPTVATYQDLPNLTTPNSPDQIANSPKPAAAQELNEIPAASAGMTREGSVNSP